MPLQIVATDSIPGRTLTYSATGLPSGISINSSTGLITGTPTTQQTKNTVVTVTDNTGISSSVNFPWTISSVHHGAKGFVGGTINAATYGSATLTDAMNTLDGYINSDGGSRKFSYSCQKFYYENSKWPTSLTSINDIRTAKNLGVKCLLSFKPAADSTNAYTATLYRTEKTNLANAIALYKNANVNFEVTLFQEANDGHPEFPNAAAYHAYWSFYGPTVLAAGIPLVYDPGMSYPSAALTFFPSNPNPTKVVVDFYAVTYVKKGTTLDAIETKTDAIGVPFGAWELGDSNNITAGEQLDPGFGNYCTYLTNLFTARTTAGKDNADLCFFCVPHSSSFNVITGPSDFKVPHIQQLYDAVSV